MKLCLSWLEEWLERPLEPRALSEKLTMAGLEVDQWGPVAAAMSGLVVGCVRHVEPHPDADRLKVCKVDGGGDSLLQVVCGAPNVREGIYVPFAAAGARIGEVKIAETEIRGVLSQGMLCSANELGLEENAAGLLEFDGEVAAGTDLIEYFHLDDVVIELDLTPNRADCFSILGLAREVAALYGEQLKMPRQNPVAPVHEQGVAVQVSEAAACPRYLARVVRNVKHDAKTPLWMKERLSRSGVNALHPVVDVMNYVMLELGQPLHSFDLDKVQDAIEVRYAKAGEKIRLIGGAEVELDRRALLIADKQGPLALAGIMGGADSAVSEKTRNVLVECAFFAREAVMGVARSYGLHTESSLRFERGVDPTLQPRAMERACELLEEIAGGECGPLVEVAVPEKPTPPIELRHKALVRRLGVEIDRNKISNMLARLECRMKPCKGGWLCTPPPHRFDLEIEEDLIEEVGRLYGYDKINADNEIPAEGVSAKAYKPLDNRYERDNSLCDRLVERGYFEVVTYSFVEPGLLAMINDTPALSLSNAVSPAMSMMRVSLWPGLLKTLTYNLNRQQERVRIFELGQCFEGESEHSVIAGLAYGDVYPEQWGTPRRACDFYDLKGDVENLLIEYAAGLSYQRSKQRGLHLGCAVEIRFNDRLIGCLGALDPAVAQQLEIAGEVFLFEMRLDALDLPEVARVEPVSRYPAVRRDLSLTVPAEVSADQIQACIRGLGIDLLREALFFDVYANEKIGYDRKSITLGLIFQDISSTLSDEICGELVDKIVAALRESLKADLRS